MILKMSRLFFSLLATTALVACSAQQEATPAGSALIETDEVTVSAETAGRLTSLRVTEGDRVALHDTIATIDDSRVRLEIESARSGRKVIEFRVQSAVIQAAKAERQFAFAEGEKKRIESLVRSGSATSRALDVALNEYDQAQQNLRSSQTLVRSARAEEVKANADIDRLLRQLEDCSVLAPQAGTITERLVEAGELAAPGKGLVKISKLDTVWAKLYLPAPALAKVKLGDRARVATESGGTIFDGTIVWTSDRAEFTPKNVQTESARADLVYAVKVQIPNPTGQLKVGMPVFVTMTTPVP